MPVAAGTTASAATTASRARHAGFSDPWLSRRIDVPEFASGREASVQAAVRRAWSGRRGSFALEGELAPVDHAAGDAGLAADLRREVGDAPPRRPCRPDARVEVHGGRGDF